MPDQSDSAWCSKCRRITTWAGTVRRLRCSGCNTEFPCIHDCSHWDCLEVKGLAVPDAQGVLRERNRGTSTSTTPNEGPRAVCAGDGDLPGGEEL
jgi:hypothetical protein